MAAAGHHLDFRDFVSCLQLQSPTLRSLSCLPDCCRNQSVRGHFQSRDPFSSDFDWWPCSSSHSVVGAVRRLSTRDLLTYIVNMWRNSCVQVLWVESRIAFDLNKVASGYVCDTQPSIYGQDCRCSWSMEKFQVGDIRMFFYLSLSHWFKICFTRKSWPRQQHEK